MTLLDDVRLGAQRPRWQKLPPSVASSAGPEAVDLAASAGIILDDWQEWWLGHALSERPDGNWSAKENVLITGRQAGKNGVLGALELFYLFLLGDPLVIHSAHELPTAINHFNFMLAVIDGCPDLSKKCKRPTFTNGEQAINLRSGAMLKFRARGKNSGRGLTASRLVFDEAFKIAAESMGALMPTLRAMRNTQITYASSAPKHDSNVLHGLINRGRADDPDDRLFYAEWGNPIGTAMDDVDAWYQANPSLGVIRSNGTGVEEQSLHDEYRSLVSGGDEDLIAEFAREAAGIGELPLTVDAKPIKIPADKWASDLTEADILERWPKATSLAFDVTRDGDLEEAVVREPNDANVFAEISKAFRLTDNNGLPLPQPTQYKRIADDAVPADRTYRNAWTLNGETIEHDMEKARQIQMDRIRRARTAELGKLDSAMSQADEAVFVAGKDVVAAQAAEAAKAAIIDQKQVLRDLPATFDLSKAATTEELKALWPADLPRL